MKRLLALLILPCATVAFAQFNPTGGLGIGSPGGFGSPGGSRPVTPTTTTTTSRVRSGSPYMGRGTWKHPNGQNNGYTLRRYAQPWASNPFYNQNQRRFQYVVPTRRGTINLR